MEWCLAGVKSFPITLLRVKDIAVESSINSINWQAVLLCAWGGVGHGKQGRDQVWNMECDHTSGTKKCTTFSLDAWVTGDD